MHLAFQHFWSDTRGYLKLYMTQSSMKVFSKKKKKTPAMAKSFFVFNFAKDKKKVEN